MARLQEIYRNKIVADLTAKFGYKSVMEVPRLTKITLNMGVSEAVADKKVMDHAVGDLTKALGDPEVRMAAVGALAQMGSTAKESEKALRAMVEDKKNKRDKALMGAVKDALKKVKG